jgi:hypothetical protein
MVRALPVVAGNERALPRGVARGPVAILSLHSHRDRSFLDDISLHESSGALRAAGIENDLVIACITTDEELPRLAAALLTYPTIVYERVWSASIIRALAASLPGARFVRMIGEHEISDAPADEVCAPHDLVAVIAHLLDRPVPETFEVRPNVTPVYVAEEDRPARPSFPIKGSAGCPYSADARGNPLFDGLAIPERFGRGCAFCTTGNAYEHKKPADALASTLDQLRYLRQHAAHIETLVLRDQNPFAYLTELVEAAETEQLGPFTLLVESRADWWLQNSKRFERALAAARRSSIRIAPFLVGVENFSQRELDRFNKGIEAEINVRFLHQLRAWANDYAPAVDLGQGAFGFILFTPWTTLDDLRANYACIEETKLHELRGRLLLSRARLYRDTALYYLAERDGLLIDEYASRGDDASARYGYLPAHPWRFADPLVARVAEVGALVLERRGYRDELAVFRALLAVASEGIDALTLEAVESQIVPANADAKRKLAELLVRAPALPVTLPLFDLELTDLMVERDEVLLLLRRNEARATIRVRRPGDVVVDATSAPSLAPELSRIAARLARSISDARWSEAAPLRRALSRQS